MLWAVAAVALPVREATKLTLGQDLSVKAPHEVNTLLRGDPHKWLSTSRVTQYRDCYVRTPLSGPESGHSLSCGRRRALTGLQGNMPADLDLRDQPIPRSQIRSYTPMAPAW